jgi:hypothetical protein
MVREARTKALEVSLGEIKLNSTPVNFEKLKHGGVEVPCFVRPNLKRIDVPLYEHSVLPRVDFPNGMVTKSLVRRKSKCRKQRAHERPIAALEASHVFVPPNPWWRFVYCDEWPK